MTSGGPGGAWCLRLRPPEPEPLTFWLPLLAPLLVAAPLTVLFPLLPLPEAVPAPLRCDPRPEEPEPEADADEEPVMELLAASARAELPSEEPASLPWQRPSRSTRTRRRYKHAEHWKCGAW